jgi:hypothetical protein
LRRQARDHDGRAIRGDLRLVAVQILAGLARSRHKILAAIHLHFIAHGGKRRAKRDCMQPTIAMASLRGDFVSQIQAIRGKTIRYERSSRLPAGVGEISARGIMLPFACRELWRNVGWSVENSSARPDTSATARKRLCAGHGAAMSGFRCGHVLPQARQRGCSAPRKNMKEFKALISIAQTGLTY